MLDANRIRLGAGLVVGIALVGAVLFSLGVHYVGGALMALGAVIAIALWAYSQARSGSSVEELLNQVQQMGGRHTEDGLNFDGRPMSILKLEAAPEADPKNKATWRPIVVRTGAKGDRVRLGLVRWFDETERPVVSLKRREKDVFVVVDGSGDAELWPDAQALIPHIPAL